MGSSSDSVKALCALGMLIGIALAVEHYVSNGRWTDEEKEDCHGKVGIGLFLLSLFGKMLVEP